MSAYFTRYLEFAGEINEFGCSKADQVPSAAVVSNVRPATVTSSVGTKPTPFSFVPTTRLIITVASETPPGSATVPVTERATIPGIVPRFCYRRTRAWTRKSASASLPHG